MAIEVDGSIHFEEGQQEKDAYRQKRLESFGVHFMRFNDLDVKDNLNFVLSEIKEKIENLKKPNLTSRKPTPNLPKIRDKLSEEGNSSVL